MRNIMWGHLRFIELTNVRAKMLHVNIIIIVSFCFRLFNVDFPCIVTMFGREKYRRHTKTTVKPNELNEKKKDRELRDCAIF